jgi:hypothetical protein
MFRYLNTLLVVVTAAAGGTLRLAADTTTSTTTTSEKYEWAVSSSTAFPLNIFQLVIMEGLCNNGKNFIVNSKDQIFVMNDKFEILYSLPDAIPHDLRQQYGYNHLGDCQFADGLIYFPLEEPTYTIPALFVYSLATDNSIEFVTYKAQSTQEHMPWVAMDPSSRLLYSSNYDNVSTIQIYNENLEFVKDLKIDMILDKVQGGAFYDNLLYLGVNGGDTVYTVDVSTGVVQTALIQTEPGSDAEYEFEGITFLDLRDKGMGLMHNTGEE